MNSIAVLDLQNPEMNAYLVNHLKSADFLTLTHFLRPILNSQALYPLLTTTRRGKNWCQRTGLMVI